MNPVLACKCSADQVEKIPAIPYNKCLQSSNTIEIKLKRRPYLYLLEPGTHKTRVNVAKICVETVLRIAELAAGFGMIVGIAAGVAGGIVMYVKTKNLGAALACFGSCVAGGTVVGGAIGTFVGLHQAYQKGEIFITQSREYINWRQKLTQEQYTVFLTTLRSYLEEERIDKTATNESLICPITRDIPLLPYVSPNGQTYEKEAIEEHLDIAWAAVERMRASNFPEDKIEKQLSAVCPLRGKPFRKEELTYSEKFAKSAIQTFKRLVDKVERTYQSNPDGDPVVLEGLLIILKHYQRLHKEVTDRTIRNLTQDLIRAEATDKMSKAIISQYERGMLVE